jgi:multimeric flavodoxin WrbA
MMSKLITMDKVICNMCSKTFKDDEELKQMEDQDGFFMGCPTCKTDGYLMDIEGVNDE